MSETDTAPTQTIDDTDTGTNEETTPASTGTEKTYTTADLDRIVERRLERERSKYADYEKIKADAMELANLREADQDEIRKAIERAEAAEQRIAKAEFNALRAKVAAEKGVPTSSLVGETEEELAASADELIAWRDQNAAPPARPPAKRTPNTSSGLKSGATGTENTNHDPKAAAAEALRRLRNDG